jgi:hypothetical protein
MEEHPSASGKLYSGGTHSEQRRHSPEDVMLAGADSGSRADLAVPTALIWGRAAWLAFLEVLF